MRRCSAPSVDALEGRQLLAGSMNFSAGTLSLYADAGATHAALAPGAAPGTVVATVDGQSQTFRAADVKLVVFYGSNDGRDSFENDTGLTTVSDLAGTGNSVVGGTGTDYVVDATGTADVDDRGGGMLVADGPHTYSVSLSPRTGQVIVRIK